MGKHSAEKTKPGRTKKALKIIGIILLILVVIALGVVAGGYLYLRNGLLGQMQQVEINKENIEINEGVEQALEGYRVIALFGVDSRSNELEVGTRSDCIMLAIINQKNKNVKLVSVYRDTYLQIAKKGLDKVTHAYAYGGPELSMSTLNTNLDLNITEFATVNFDSLVDIVDAIGGIKMNITSEETKYINNYIAETSKVVGKKSSQITKAGTYNLDGVQAVSYCRIRYTSGGDYKRTERMRDVLTAILDKAKTLDVGKLNKLASTVLPEVLTNINPDEVISLIPQLASYKIEKTDSMGWPYETKGATINGVWYGVPINLEKNVEKLHQEVLEQADYKASEKVKSISDSIIKKTGYK